MLESLPESLKTLKRLKTCTVQGCKKLQLPDWFANKFPKSLAQGKAMVMQAYNMAAPLIEDGIALGAKKVKQVKEKTKETLDVVLNVAAPVVADGIALGAKKIEQAKEQTKEKLGVVLNVASPVVADGIALGAKKVEQAKEQTKEKLDVVLNVASPVVNKGIEQGAKIGKGMLSAGSKAGSFMASSASSFGSSLFSKDKKSPAKDAVNDDDDTWGFAEKKA